MLQNSWCPYVSSNRGACEHGDVVTTGVPRRFAYRDSGKPSQPAFFSRNFHQPRLISRSTSVQESHEFCYFRVLT